MVDGTSASLETLSAACVCVMDLLCDPSSVESSPELSPMGVSDAVCLTASEY